MAFFKLDDITDSDAYKKARNASLSRIGEKPFTFIYSKKHNFTMPAKKTQSLFVFENGKIDAAIMKAVKAATTGSVAEGMCYKNQDDVLVFQLLKGDVDGFDMVPKFQIGDSAERPPEAPPTPETPAPEPKAEEQEAEGQQEEEESPDFKIRLVNGLKKVKTANGKESFAFVACIAKPFYGVLFGKNSKEQIGPTHKKVLSDLTQGTRFIVGRCLFENNAHTFVVDPPPGGLAKKLQMALKEFTGQAYKVRVRDTESKTVADGDTDVDPEEEQDAAAAQAKAQEGAAFKQRLAAMQPQIAKATASKTPQGDEIKQRATQMGASASKGDFAQANEILDAIEALLKTAPTSPPPPPSSAQTPKAPPPPPDGNGQPKDIKLSTYLTGRANLRKAREAAEKGLKDLQAAILAKSKDEAFYPEIEAKSQQLFDFLKPIDDSVADKLDEAGRCTDPEVQAELNKKVRELIQKQLAEMRAHPLASFVEKNPFGKFVIKQPLEVTLAALDTQLS